jgi:anti-anti-sigma factor
MRIRVEESLNSYGLFPMPGGDGRVACRQVQQVVVIDLKGQLAEGQSVHLLHDTIREWLDEGAKDFAINLAGISSADSYTLGGLAGAYNLIKQAGGRIKFFAASERLIRTFKKLHLDTVLELLENEASALSDFY